MMNIKESNKGFFIRGILLDSLTDEPIENAFIAVKGHPRATMSNSKGIFEIDIPCSPSIIEIKCQGYEKRELKITRNRVNVYTLRLASKEETLAEVVIKQNRYTKKNNPAVELMEHIRRKSAVNDPEKKPYYSYSTYQRITFGLNNVDVNGQNRAMFKRYPFLIDHIDTSEISGKLILPLSLREQTSTVHHRLTPRSKREIVEGKRSEGIDEILDEESMRKFMNDIMGPVNIYDRDINILQNRFVSPLSPLAADFYKFYITDSVLTPDSIKYYTLNFYPHSRESFGFIGQMIVSCTDTSAFVKSISLKVPKEINLNFIENLVITQLYEQNSDGTRLKTRDEMSLEASLVPGTQGLYARRVIEYKDHTFQAPQNQTTIFKPKAPVSEHNKALIRDSIYWNDVRPADLNTTELKINKMMERLRANKVFYWGEKVLGVLVNGYIPTNRDQKLSKFDFGPMNTTISANPLEGARFRAGGMTTAALNPHWFGRFYSAWGTKDHKWKYGLELEYSFYRKNRHSREFPIHSLSVTSSYDVLRPGQNYIFTNPDNVFLSLHRPGEDPIIYQRDNSLTYKLETETNFSIKLSVTNKRMTGSRLFQLKNIENQIMPSASETFGEIELRYAPGEKFYQTASNRFPLNLDNPTVTLNHKIGVKGIESSKGINVTSLSYMQRFWFSAFGYLDTMIKASHAWSRSTPFFYLATANTNMSYTIQPESFALTAPLEFVADSHCSMYLSYWLNGNLLNRIPLLKKLKLREVVSFRGFYGHLSDRNDPVVQKEMIVWPGCESQSERLKVPYFEGAVGLDNILRCLRIDYVWRLNHRENLIRGGSRHGVRIAFHVTF